jgi:predicted nucleic acid-binding protein
MYSKEERMQVSKWGNRDVVVYAFRKDDPRSQVAEALLAVGGALSVQILNEFVAVARRKLDRSWEEIGRALAILRTFCPEPVALTALVVAAALEAGCDTLYSEDFHDGQMIDGQLTIRNPSLDHPVRTSLCLQRLPAILAPADRRRPTQNVGA